VEKIKPEGGITFLPQPKVNQTIENKRIEVDSQFKQAKSAGVERVAVQLPNNSEEEKTVAFLNMVKEVASKNNISVSTWESNWIGGSKIPFNHITLELIKAHPDWFLHTKDGKIMTGYESGAKHVYPNPLNLELSKYVDSLRRKYSGILDAKGLVVDDLALPIYEEQQAESTELDALVGVPLETNQSEEELMDPRLVVYKLKLKELKNFTRQVGIPLSISSQNNTQSTNFYAFQQAQAAGVDEIVPQIYSQNNPLIFKSVLSRTLNELKKTNGKIKVTPVFYAGNNSAGEIQEMSVSAREKLGSKDVGIFPIAGVSSLAEKDSESLNKVFKPDSLSNKNKLNQ
jgi:hypothetical protein